MKAIVFVRGASTQDVEFLNSIMSNIKAEEYSVVDVLVESKEKLEKIRPIELGIAFGKITGRMVDKYIEHLFILPELKQLTPCDKNIPKREIAWKTIQQINALIEGKPVTSSSTNSWHTTVYLPDQRKLIIYEEKFPENVEGDIFMKKEDSELLMRIKEAFGAESIIIGKE